MSEPDPQFEAEAVDREEKRARRGRDEELATLEKIVWLLEDLLPNQRRDAIEYLTRRYNRVPQSLINETLERR